MLTRKVITRFFNNVIDNILILTYNENPTLKNEMTYEQYRDYILSEYNNQRKENKK